jgi:hypothetical protein
MRAGVLIADAFGAVSAADARAAGSEALQFAVGAVWLLAAIGKARTPGSARDAVTRLIDGPAALIALLARLAVPVELALAAALLLRFQAHAAAVASIVLFTLFAVALTRAAVRDALPPSAGARPAGDCGCFGPSVRATAVRSRAPAALDASAATRPVARNLVLVVLAVAAAFGA